MSITKKKKKKKKKKAIEMNVCNKFIQIGTGLLSAKSD